VSSQSSLPPDRRRSVTIAVDEFHTIPGADYEQVFGELAKFGANMMLATQTLARLDRLTEADRTRDLRAAVFSNLDGLFAFHTSAEDAEYLAEELGGGLDKQDVLELGHYQCYARLTDVRTGERLPAFNVRLDMPPAGDQLVAEQLANASAQRYGRRVLEVELDLQAAAERIRGTTPSSQPATSDQPDPAPIQAGGGTAAARAANGAEIPKQSGTRRKRRDRPAVRARGGPKVPPDAQRSDNEGEQSAA
jgi:hypothetical protein